MHSIKRFIEKQFARLLLLISGWSLEGEVPDIKKCVIIGAPHTSNWDFFFGLLYKMYYGLNIHFLMKEELFRFPWGIFFKAIGGIPVNRGKKNNLVETLYLKFTQTSAFYLAIAPEGTRNKVKEWRRGFYYIAKKASVPIVLAYMDYSRKVVGVGMLFYPGDSIEKDMAEIQSFYLTVSAKYPQQFSIQEKP
jgi:1-acyl-sn-glycerol-3-phosphate acyltransferase